jgi:hypothetical protein
MQKFNLIRVIFFQVAWIVFASWSYNIEYVAPIFATFFVLIDFYIFNKEISLVKFISFYIFILFSGIFIDSILSYFGFISFLNHDTFLSPFYLWSIWIIFVPYYQFAFKKFHKKLYLSLPLALVGAPLAYYGGAKFGNLIIHTYAYLAIAFCWSIFFPISIEIYTRLENLE